MSFFLITQRRYFPLFSKFVLKSLFIGHGFIIVQYRRRVQIIIRKSRMAKEFGRRDLRLFYLKRFSRLFFYDYLFFNFYSRRISFFSRTRRSGMCVAIIHHLNPMHATFKLRNKLAGEHVKYTFCFFSPIILFMLRLEVPVIKNNAQSKPYYFIPNLAKHPIFEGLQ